MMMNQIIMDQFIVYRLPPTTSQVQPPMWTVCAPYPLTLTCIRIIA